MPAERVLDESIPEDAARAARRLAAPVVTAGDLWKTFGASVPALVAGLVLLGFAFATEAVAAWRVWMDSTAYSHCLFVLPIALYLAWDRRGHIVAVPVVALPWAAVAVAPLGLAWLVAERLGIMEGRQLVALTIVEVLFLAVLGWRMARALAAPLLYLYFLVPFGLFLTPILQDWTAWFSVLGLEFLEIPHYVDHYLIEIPAGRFYVAEACAGFRFLVASIAFGVLYACLMYRDLSLRLAFIAMSIIVPIVANWFRALGIIVLGHFLGSAEAAAADHILYGWLFFSAIMLLLTVIGLPFRQEPAPDPERSATVAPPAGRVMPAVAAIAVLAWIGPAISMGLDRLAQVDGAAPTFRWTAPAGCTAAPVERAVEMAGSASTVITCGQMVLTAAAQVFSPRVNPAVVGAAQRRLTGEAQAEDVSSGTLTAAGLVLPTWRLTIANTPLPAGARTTVTALWIDDAPAPGGLFGRIAMARNSIFGAPTAPVVLAVSVRSPRPKMGQEEERYVRKVLTAFLEAQTALSAELRRVARPGGAGG